MSALQFSLRLVANRRAEAVKTGQKSPIFTSLNILPFAKLKAKIPPNTAQKTILFETNRKIVYNYLTEKYKRFIKTMRPRCNL